MSSQTRPVFVWSSTLFLYLQPSQWVRSHHCTLYSVLKSQGSCNSSPKLSRAPSGTSIDFFSWSMWVQVACATSVHVLWHEGWSRVNLGESVPRIWCVRGTCGVGGRRRLDCGVGGSPQPSSSFWGSVKVISLLAKNVPFIELILTWFTTLLNLSKAYAGPPFGYFQV